MKHPISYATIEILHIAAAFTWATHPVWWFGWHTAEWGAFTGIVMLTQALCGGCPISIVAWKLCGADDDWPLWRIMWDWSRGFGVIAWGARLTWAAMAAAILLKNFA